MVNKESSSSDHDLEHELALLRQEVAELRSEHTMHLDTEEGLHALERQLASIIHSAMDGIITIDDEHNIVLFNAAAEEIFQWRRTVEWECIERFLGCDTQGSRFRWKRQFLKLND